MIFLSDPYSVEGTISHSNDWLVLLPVYKDGRIIAYTSMFGHMSDIGGKVAGSMPIDATSIFQEGVRIPPVKIWRKGEYNADLVKLVMHQTRTPEWCKADLNALIAACRVAAKRVVEMAERFGDDVFATAGDLLLERNHRAMKGLIDTAIGEEKVSFEDYICDDGLGYGPYKIKCTMWRENGKVVLDFAGTDPQSHGSINFLLNENMMRMFFGIYMIMVIDPQILFNDGYYDLIDVRIPEGSLLKPKFPAALSGRTHALGRLFDILGGLLGQKTPEFLCAAGFSSSPHLFYSGAKPDGEWFQLFQIGFGGIPGRPMGDGPDGHSLWPNFTNVPNEFLERYFPLRIERYTSVADSGGAGLHRGGNGILMTYKFLEAGQHRDPPRPRPARRRNRCHETICLGLLRHQPRRDADRAAHRHARHHRLLDLGLCPRERVGRDPARLRPVRHPRRLRRPRAGPARSEPVRPPGQICRSRQRSRFHRVDWS